MPESERARIIGRIADHLRDERPGHVLRVAIDGVTAAGKTTLADELAGALRERGRAAIRLTMDGFHNPREQRYRQGRESAVGYYRDAYDHESLRQLVLMPLGPDGDGSYLPAILDLASDEPARREPMVADPDAVLVVDGTFLQGPALAGHWDEVVFVHTDLAQAEARGIARDVAAFESEAAAEGAYRRRYHAACLLYLDEVSPAAQASILVDNSDLDRPVLRRIGGTSTDATRVFSYGTLQQADVQLATFGRHLVGSADELPGHRRDWVTITDRAVIEASGSDRHPIVRASDKPDDRVDGTVLTLTTEELAAADQYEVADYRRVRVRLKSGTDAWVYLARPDANG